MTHVITIPDQLRVSSLAYVKLHPKSKRPFENGWQKHPNSLKEIEEWTGTGSNYGLLGGYGDLIVIDTDTPALSQYVLSTFPPTFTVKTPRAGYHFYYICSDIKKKIVLKKGNTHFGDIIAHGSQVVGPGSIHPDTGTEYTVDKNIPIASITQEELISGLIEYLPASFFPKKDIKIEKGNLIVLNVLAKAGILTKSVGDQFVSSHPVHSSTNGNNFVVSPEKDVWHCFRCNSGGGAMLLIAVIEGVIQCEDALPGGLRGEKFLKTLEIAREKYNLIDNTFSPPSDEWAHPIPLENSLLAPWPQGVFPALLEEFVIEVSESTETPIELAALTALAVLGTAAHGKYRVHIIHSYFEPVNIWTCVALPSGNRKTAVLGTLVKPLIKEENDMREEIATKIKQAESEHKTQQAKIDHLRKKAAKESDPFKSHNLIEEIKSLEANLPEIPKIPQIWAEDVTPENLGTIMADNQDRMGILSDEGGIFDIMAGRYSNGIPNLDIFLKGHAGSPLRVNRGSRPPILMNHPALSLGLSPQPDILRTLTQKQGFRGRGLLARFLYAIPPSNLGYRPLKMMPLTDKSRQVYHQIITTVLKHPAADPLDDQVTYDLEFTTLALNLWTDFSRSNEKKMREGGTFEHITDWAGKLPGAVARISGLLHIARKAFLNPWDYKIDEIDMNSAIHIAEALSSHALAAFDLMGADKALDDARIILRWIKRLGNKSFSFRDAHYAHKNRFKRAHLMDDAINILIERHFIRRQRSEEKKHGRPSRIFDVNPTVLAK